MKVQSVILGGGLLLASAATGCNHEQYKSPNSGACKDKKSHGEYCNAIQSCHIGLACESHVCTDSNCPIEPAPKPDIRGNYTTLGFVYETYPGPPHTKYTKADTQGGGYSGTFSAYTPDFVGAFSMGMGLTTPTDELISARFRFDVFGDGSSFLDGQYYLKVDRCPQGYSQPWCATGGVLVDVEDYATGTGFEADNCGKTGQPRCEISGRAGTASWGQVTLEIQDDGCLTGQLTDFRAPGALHFEVHCPVIPMPGARPPAANPSPFPYELTASVGPMPDITGTYDTLGWLFGQFPGGPHTSYTYADVTNMRGYFGNLTISKPSICGPFAAARGQCDPRDDLKTARFDYDVFGDQTAFRRGEYFFNVLRCPQGSKNVWCAEAMYLTDDYVAGTFFAGDTCGPDAFSGKLFCDVSGYNTTTNWGSVYFEILEDGCLTGKVSDFTSPVDFSYEIHCPKKADPPHFAAADLSGGASYSFGKGSVKTACPNEYKDAFNGDNVTAIAETLPMCHAFELTNEAYSWVWDAAPFEVIRPDGSIHELCPYSGPGSLVNFHRLRVQGDNPAYSNDYLGSFFEQEVGGTYTPCDGTGNEMFFITYIRVTTETDYNIKNFNSNCFTEYQFVDGGAQCNYYHFWTRGSNKFTASVWNANGAVVSYPVGTTVRMTEQFDFSDVSDSIWARAHLNGKPVDYFQKGTYYPGGTFTVPSSNVAGALTATTGDQRLSFDFGASLTNKQGLDGTFTQYNIKAWYVAERTVSVNGKYLSARLDFPMWATYPFESLFYISWHPMVQPTDVSKTTNGDATTRSGANDVMQAPHGTNLAEQFHKYYKLGDNRVPRAMP